MSLFRKKPTPVPGRRRYTETGARPSDLRDTSSSQAYSFRRNQTLTGSASSQVVSANEQRGQLKSSRVQAHQLRRKRKHLGLTLVLTCMVVGGLFVLLANFIAVPTASVTVAHTQDDSDTYAQIIAQYFDTQPLERSLLVLNQDHLLQTIQAQRPEVKRIADIHTNYMGTVNFTLTARQPIAGWSINGEQRYVDAQGVAFTRNYYGNPGVTIVDESGLPSDGKTVASNRFLGFIGRVVGAANTQGLTVTKVTLPFATSRQIAVYVQQVGYPTKLSVDRPAGEQVEDMARVVRHVQAHGLDLEYVDVRVSGRAYYREK